ncbi:MAG: hypothetical protein ABIP97_09645 [Chthoniobacterales bacterium]
MKLKHLAAIVVMALSLSASHAADPAKYPVTTCIVSGDNLNEGKPYVFQYEGKTVELCCKRCYKAFQKDPAKYIKKLDAAEKKSS